jgi:hypothetical protein
MIPTRFGSSASRLQESVHGKLFRDGGARSDAE